MRSHSIVRHVALTLLLIGALPGDGAAQDRLELTSGRVYSGDILSDDGETVEIKTSAGATLKLRYDSLTPMSRYRLVRKRTADDVSSQLDLADWCVDEVLYEQARRHFDAALSKDALRAEEVLTRLDAARTKAGNDSLARAKAMMAAGRDKEARGVLGRILQELPLEPVAKEAAELLHEEVVLQKEELLAPAVIEANKDIDPREGKHATRTDGKPYSNRARQLMRPTVQRYYNIIDWTTAGLVTNSQVNSIELFTAAIKEGPKLLQEADAMRPRAEKDDEIAEAIALAVAKTQEVVVTACVNLTQIYLLQEAFDDADKVVDGRLADYPDNERLLHLQERIADARASGRAPVILGRSRDP